MTPGADLIWQGVFKCRLEGGVDHRSLMVAPLGDAGWRQVVQKTPAFRQSSIPYPVRLTLPALFAGEVLYAVPHLNYADYLEKMTGPVGFAPIFEAKFLELSDRPAF